ncbi:unnamed protein product [Amoebophrya sp. A25]|nr:unnamed protein product [Amoebophrya sp. A25]|eukprot:GSA25T00007737001.1
MKNDSLALEKQQENASLTATTPVPTTLLEEAEDRGAAHTQIMGTKKIEEVGEPSSTVVDRENDVCSQQQGDDVEDDLVEVDAEDDQLHQFPRHPDLETNHAIVEVAEGLFITDAEGIRDQSAVLHLRPRGIVSVGQEFQTWPELHKTVLHEAGQTTLYHNVHKLLDLGEEFVADDDCKEPPDTPQDEIDILRL